MINNQQQQMQMLEQFATRIVDAIDKRDAMIAAKTAESLNGALLRGARPIPLGQTPGASNRPITTATAIMGFALRNLSASTSNNVTVSFYDGDSTNGQLILDITLAPGESARDWFGPNGIHVGTRGLYVTSSDVFDGSLFVLGAA